MLKRLGQGVPDWLEVHVHPAASMEVLMELVVERNSSGSQAAVARLKESQMALKRALLKGIMEYIQAKKAAVGQKD